jgi:hypothetical protein
LRRIILPLVVALAMLLVYAGVVLAADPPPQTVTMNSVADAGLTQQSPTTNSGSATSLKADGDDPDRTGSDVYAALRWDLSSVPADAKVSSATVTLNISNHANDTGTPQNYAAFALKKPWDESQITWNRATTGTSWTSAGAKDLVTDRGLQIAEVTPTAFGSYTFTVPAPVVQGWLDNPSSNNGILLAQSGNADGFIFDSKEGTTPPKLTVNYRPAGTDTTSPETTINSGPTGTFRNSSASFTFSSNEGNSSFECKLDGDAFATCGSSKGYSGLSEGAHTFSVRATDADGNVDATPASRTWTVDTTTQSDPVVVGAGDIGSCESTGDEATARLIDGIPATVLTLGDHAFENGTATEFTNCYDPSWGRFKARTVPTVGNHDYQTQGATGYYNYFGSAAGDSNKGYYSYDLGDWHVVSLNSMCGNAAGEFQQPGGCGPDSPMVTWLKQDLAANPTACTLATFHHPLFNSGNLGNHPKMKPIWEALYASGADVVLNAHQHSYERFAPQTPDGVADPAFGIREFVSGAGGASHEPFATIQPNSQVRNNTAYGVTKFTLHPNGYDWQFVPQAGKTFTDSGSDQCHGVDATPPTVATVAPADGATGVDAISNAGATFSEAMDASTINTSTFTLTRQGAAQPLAAQVAYDQTTRKATLTPADGLEASTTYTVTVKGGSGGVKDLAGNPLAQDKTWSFTTSAQANKIANLGSVADAGLSQQSPNTNSGAATTLRVDGNDPEPGGNDVYAALRWDLSQIPAGATATSATVTLNVSNHANDSGTPQTYGAYEVKKAWIENQITWNQAATGTPWETAGARGPTDRGSKIADVKPTALGSHTFTIPVSVVQGWLNAPSSNNGIVLADTTNDDGFIFSSKEGTTAPKLAFTYTAASDTSPPETSIDSGPTGTVGSASATFGFTSNESGSTFECKLDGGSFGSCTSPKSYTGLSDGSHTFSVRATDAAGNVDATPVSRTWTVDTGLPNTTIDSEPASLTNSASATFGFSSDDANATFECKLDGGNFSACASPKSYAGLSDGAHTFSVRATDASGNTDDTPGTYTWTVDTTAPGAPLITSPPDGANINDGNVTISGTAEPGSTVELFDGASSQGTTQTAGGSGGWSKTLTGVAEGEHTYTAKATDSAGNTSPASEARTVVVDANAPETAIDSGPSGTVGSASATFGFSSDESGSSFECKLDGAGFSSCTSPKNYANLSDGSHTFSVRATDASGNVDTTPATRTWTVDTGAPDVPSVQLDPGSNSGSQDDNITNDNTPTIGGTAEAGSTIRVYNAQNNVVASLTPDAQDHWVYTFATLQDGSYQYTVKATDASGNESGGSSLGITIDTLAPGAPSRLDLIEASDSGDPDDDTTNDNTPTFEVTAEAGSLVKLYKGGDTTPLGTATANNGAADANGNKVASITSSQLADGTYAISADATDVAGNTSASSATLLVTVDLSIDTAAPQSTIDSRPASPSNNSSPSFTFSSSEANSAFECKLDSGTFAPCSSPKNYTGLSDGSHTFSVRATDAAGNTDASPDSYTWTIESTNPDTTIDSGPSGTVNSAAASFEFSSTKNGSTFECKLDNGSFAACASPQNYAGLSDGPHTFSVRATDAAGNVDGTPATRTWSVDTGPPNTTIDSKPASLTNSTSATFGFSSDESGSTFECSLDGNAFSVCTSPRNFTGLSDGPHTFRVRATDAGGNTDATPDAYTWTVDTTAADTTIDSGPSGTVGSSSASFTFSSSETNSTFECKLDGGSFGSCTSPKSYAGLSEGTHTFSVRATDAAGNADATPATRTWTVSTAPLPDTTPPETTIGSGPSGAVSSSSASFTFSSSESGSTFECKLDAGSFTACTSPTSYTRLSNGSHTFSVRAKDAAGNVDATPDTRTWTVDTAAPNTTIGSGPSGTVSSSSASFTFSSTEANSSFECKLDTGAYATCASPNSYTGLSNGSHTFSVRAKDAAGNVDATPATRTWTISTTTRLLTSTADTRISENAPSTDFGATTTLVADGDEPAGSGRDVYSLLRWDLSSVPAGSQISSVTITLDVTNASKDTYQIYDLERPWVEPTTTWLQYAAGQTWEVAGAKGSLDRGIQVGSLAASKTGQRNFTLSSSLVQGWVDNPSSNNGILIASSTSADDLVFSSREAATSGNRPQLSVTYTTP